jgi:metallophosphoesterase superfamily enzyme
VHLSDLHAKEEQDEDHFGKKRVAESLVKDLREQTEEEPVDLFVFSGDLAFDGTTGALETGKSVLLDPIRSIYPETPFILVPGNHDVDRQRVEDVEEQGLQAVLNSREAVQKRLADVDHAAAARKRLTDWDRFALEWDAKLEAIPVPPYGHRYELTCNGLRVAIGAFDTAWRSQGGESDKGRLVLGADSVTPFLEAASDADVSVVTFHHPLGWFAKFDGEAVDKKLQGSRALVLTGHEHAADPKLEQTPRGAALYCACPSTYADVNHPNGYAIIDVDVPGQATAISLRKWQPNGDRFGIDAETTGDTGQVLFQWPIPTEMAPVPIHAPREAAIEPLAQLVQEQSVLVDHLDDAESHAVSDLVVTPRFWPVPHTEVFDRSVGRKGKPVEADPFTLLNKERVAIVSGPRMSGVTTSLLWLLEQHFERVGTHFPAYVQSDPRFSLGRVNGAIELARKRSGDEHTPVIVAVDDVVPEDPRALGRLIRIVDENPDVKFILGCHDQQHETISRALEGTRVKIPTGTLYLGHFGRRETRALVVRLAGSEGSELVQRVLDLVQRQRLPRNPLNLAALISVLIREPNMAAVNETGLLQSYCNVLLDNPVGIDPDQLAMDQTRREHLLKRIARNIVEQDVSRLKRLEIEKLVSEYFEAIAFDTGSPGRQIESLIGRRVLAEDGSGVGFRYPALLHLFAAKAAEEQPDFKATLLEDQQRYAPVIRHLAGLTRSNAELLETVLEEALRVRADVADGIEVAQFDLIRDEHGLSQIKDFDQARALVERKPVLPSEEELDEIYDEAIEEPPEEPALRPFETPVSPDATWELSGVFGLAAGVLQSSELVEDIALRSDALREVIEAWGVMTVLMALEEDMFRQIHELLDPMLPPAADEEKRKGVIEHVVRVFIVNLMSVTLNSDAGSIHHIKILTGLLDDSKFMSVTANALFATMMYSSLEFPGWPGRFQSLIDQHGEHPMVRETVRIWARMEYHHGDVSEKDQEELLELLAEMMTPPASGGKDAVAARVAQKAEIREGLKTARTQSRISGAYAVVELDEAGSDEPKQAADI